MACYEGFLDVDINAEKLTEDEFQQLEQYLEKRKAKYDPHLIYGSWLLFLKKNGRKLSVCDACPSFEDQQEIRAIFSELKEMFPALEAHVYSEYTWVYIGERGGFSLDLKNGILEYSDYDEDEDEDEDVD